MKEFFRGWRRKVGVVTLVMACVFMAGWMRSLTFNECVMIQFRKDWSDEFASSDSSLIWACHRTRLASGLLPVFYSNRRTDDDGIWKRQFVQWRWRLLGFGHGGDDGGAKSIGNLIIHTSPSKVTVIPYWSIVIPLTALSAYLLLSKPRKLAQTKIVETVPREGT